MKEISKLKLERGSNKIELLNYRSSLLIIENNNELREIKLIDNNNRFKEIRINNLSKLKVLNIRNCKLEKLKINNCKNLRKVDLQDNLLTNLNLANCKSKMLRIVDCSNNQLTDLILPVENRIKELFFIKNNIVNFDFSTLNAKHLIALEIHRNKLEGNLSIFSRLTEIKVLCIDNNNFQGSLKSLRNLDNLEIVSFHNNPIVPSLEWLRNQVQVFYYWKGLNIKRISYNELTLSGLVLDHHSFRNFKIKSKILKKSLASFKDIVEYEEIRENLRLAFGKDREDNKFYWTRNQLTENILTNANNGFRLWLDSEILSLGKIRLDFYWKVINLKKLYPWKNKEITEVQQFEHFERLFKEHCWI